MIKISAALRTPTNAPRLGKNRVKIDNTPAIHAFLSCGEGKMTAGSWPASWLKRMWP